MFPNRSHKRLIGVVALLTMLLMGNASSVRADGTTYSFESLNGTLGCVVSGTPGNNWADFWYQDGTPYHNVNCRMQGSAPPGTIPLAYKQFANGYQVSGPGTIGGTAPKIPTQTCRAVIIVVWTGPADANGFRPGLATCNAFSLKTGKLLIQLKIPGTGHP
jgi:hypothetical protein